MGTKVDISPDESVVRILSESLGIKQAPTLVKVADGEIEKFPTVPNIKKFIQG